MTITGHIPGRQRIPELVTRLRLAHTGRVLVEGPTLQQTARRPLVHIHHTPMHRATVGRLTRHTDGHLGVPVPVEVRRGQRIPELVTRLITTAAQRLRQPPAGAQPARATREEPDRPRAGVAAHRLAGDAHRQVGVPVTVDIRSGQRRPEPVPRLVTGTDLGLGQPDPATQTACRTREHIHRASGHPVHQITGRAHRHIGRTIPVEVPNRERRPEPRTRRQHPTRGRRRKQPPAAEGVGRSTGGQRGTGQPTHTAADRGYQGEGSEEGRAAPPAACPAGKRRG